MVYLYVQSKNIFRKFSDISRRSMFLKLESYLPLFIFSFLYLLPLAIAQAGQASTISYPTSSDAGKLVVNEINVSEGYIELYVVEDVDITHWNLFYEGQGDNDGEVSICSSSCNFSAGSFIVLTSLSFHSTLQEILVLDDNNEALHYFRYATVSHQAGGKWLWKTDDPNISTYYIVNGSKNNLCSKPDGQISIEAWQECPATKGSTNLGGSVNHYQIIHDGNGLTCDLETVTILACTNDFDGSCTQSTQSGTFDLTIAGSSSQTVSGNFINGIGTIDFNHLSNETVTLSLTDAIPAASESFVCLNGGSTSCNMLFANAGFRFLYSAANSDIAHQTAGIIFPEALKLQAVQDNNGVCEGIFTGDVAVSLSQENISPAGTSGLPFQVSGNDIAKSPVFTNNVTLNFGVDSIATIPTPNYLDAGQIRLNARYSDGGIVLIGHSNNFWVKPDYFTISAQSGGSDLNATTAIGTPTHAAGTNFDFEITAYNDLGQVTTNYQQGNIELKVERMLPSMIGSVEGGFDYGNGQITSSSSFQPVTLISFDADPSKLGVSSVSNAQYSEVGVINIDVRDSDYGGVGLSVEAQDITVGRFIPDHFRQTVANHGSLMNSCDMNTVYAYSGELDFATQSKGAISYLANPVLAITAYNGQGQVTQNYYQDVDGSSQDFMHLTATSVTITPPTHDQSATGVDTNLLSVMSSLSHGEISQNNLDASDLINFGAPLPRGTLHYKLSSEDHFYYQRTVNSKVAAFTSDFDLVVTQISDGEVISTTNLTNIDNLVGINIRFGRLVVENAYGPETSDIIAPMTMQYFDGTDFITHTDDNCTRATIVNKESGDLYDAMDDVHDYRLVDSDSGDSLTVADTSAAVNSSFVNGVLKELTFSAPGAGIQGSLFFEYEVPSWLKFDWQQDGISHDDNPKALISFGLYRGNDRIISWREVGN